MDLTILTPVIALSVLIERLLETGFNVVESSYPQITQRPNYGKNKQVASTIAGIILGIISAYLLGILFFTSLKIETVTIHPVIDAIFTGAIAGALAPYSHQLVEAVLNLQKLLEALKEARENLTTGQGIGTD